MSPEEIGAFVAAVITGAGGLLATQKLHAKLQPSPSSEAEEQASAMLAVVERIEGKIDRLGAAVRGLKIEVDSAAEELQRHCHEISRLNSGFREVAGRVEALERKSIFPT
tara:strand:+ start:136 stop:465 length:330 start_codon:yes stop_codon:yes gene_type:complete